MNPTYEAVVGLEPRDQREVYLPAGVGFTRESGRHGVRHRKGGRAVPNNKEMLDWLDTSTPGWYTAMKTEERGKMPRRIIIFETSQHAALFKLFWT